MKVNYLDSFFIGAAWFLGSTFSAQAQQRNWQKVCDEDGKNCHVDNEIVVQLNAGSLNMANVGNQSMSSGLLSLFLSPHALDSLSNAVGFDMSSVTAYKIAPNIDPEQSTMVDNTGETIEMGDLWSMFLLTLPLGTKEQETCYQLRPLFPLVRFAHLNWTIEPTGPANDTFYGANQLSLHPTATVSDASINVEGAWDYETGKSTIKVGVADSGIRPDHADLQFNGASVVVAGYDGTSGTSPGNALVDPDNHGTAVAGIIGAVRNNATGIAGIAGGNGTTQGVSLYSLKCVGANADIVSAAQAIIQGVTPVANGGYGLQIINNSYSATIDQSQRLLADYNLAVAARALRLAHRAKVTMVVSAGNSIPGGYDAYYPAQARDTWTLTVGGSNQVGRYYQEIAALGGAVSAPHPFVDVVAPASNDGTTPQITAPTVYTLSSVSTTSYKPFPRTSAAAPHATGVAALMMSYHNNPALPAENLQPEDVENLLKLHAKDITAFPAQTGEDDYTGAGLINAASVLNGLRYNILYHSPAASADPSAPGIEITAVGGPQDYYMEGGEQLPAGVYNAQAYRVRINAVGAYKANYVISSRWGLNNSSSFYGPPVPFTGVPFSGSQPTPSQMVILEPEVRVVGPVGKTIVVLEGYTYQLNSYRPLLRPAIFGQPQQISATSQAPYAAWIPFDPNTNPNNDVRSMRYAAYFVNTNPGVGFRVAGAGDENSVETSQPVAYPNPTTDQATLAFTTGPELRENTAEVQLTTLAGQVVKTETATIERKDGAIGMVQLSLSGLPTGSYFYRIKTAAQVRQGRINKAD